jgi:hypothetical protein
LELQRQPARLSELESGDMGAKITFAQKFPLPNPYASQESITFPNGLIIKKGIEFFPCNGDHSVDFAVHFPNDCLNIQLTAHRATFAACELEAVGGYDVTGFSFHMSLADCDVFWLAVGY